MYAFRVSESTWSGIIKEVIDNIPYDYYVRVSIYLFGWSSYDIYQTHNHGCGVFTFPNIILSYSDINSLPGVLLSTGLSVTGQNN